MKNASEKQDVFNLCAIKTAKLIEFSADIESNYKYVLVVISSDLLFDAFRSHYKEVHFAAVDILSLVTEIRKRKWFLEETNEILDWLEHCVITYRFERENKKNNFNENEEYVNLISTCMQNCTAYLTGLKSGHFRTL